MEAEGVFMGAVSVPDIFVASLGENASRFVSGYVKELRDSGVSAERDHMARSLKAQMKYANKIGARYSLVIGDDEITKGRANLKNMETGESAELSFDEIINKLKK